MLIDQKVIVYNGFLRKNTLLWKRAPNKEFANTVQTSKSHPIISWVKIVIGFYCVKILSMFAAPDDCMLRKLKFI